MPLAGRRCGVVNAYGDRSVDWAAIQDAARREVPGAAVAAVRGVPETLRRDRRLRAYRCESGGPAANGPTCCASYGGVARRRRAGQRRRPARAGLVGLTTPTGPRAERVLAAGRRRWCSPTARRRAGARRELEVRRIGDVRGRAGAAGLDDARARGSSVPLAYSSGGSGRHLRRRPPPRSRDPIGDGRRVCCSSGTDHHRRAGEATSARRCRADERHASLYVERGYQRRRRDDLVLQLVLVALGGVLMLGGTLTATFLALSDARPDLATLSAVGASPRTRRGVAAAYALVVGFVGALLGAAVGFIPGIAITYPLTSAGDVLVAGGDVAHRPRPGSALAERALPRRPVAAGRRPASWRCRCSPRSSSGSPPGPGCRWWPGSTEPYKSQA